MSYRDHFEVLRSREAELVAELARLGDLSARLTELDAERKRAEAELARVRAMLDPSGDAASTPLLDRTRIASPCDEKWETMTGDERSRFCGRCGRSVYNLSAMTREEAERFVVENTGACLRLYRRADGTVMTTDCPEGVSRKRRLAVIRGVTAMALGVATACAAAATLREVTSSRATVTEATTGF